MAFAKLDTVQTADSTLTRRMQIESDFSVTVPIVDVLAETPVAIPMSRADAKRVLARVDQFKNVQLDFSEVPEIGQAFADEIFRVFTLAHPTIRA